MIPRLAIAFFLASVLAFSDARTEASLQSQLNDAKAQLARAQERLAETGTQNVTANNANRKAIEKLANQTQTQTDTVKQAANDTQQAVHDVQDAAGKIVDTSDATKMELARLRASMPVNSVPVWLAAIAGLVSVMGVIGSIVLAFINKGKLTEIHVLANGNLAKTASELSAANKEIADLRANGAIRSNPFS